jgi:hypothetical protein
MKAVVSSMLASFFRSSRYSIRITRIDRFGDFSATEKILGNVNMPHDIAIIIPTVCRLSLLRAIRSIYHQKTKARIQILIGVDCDPHGRGPEMFNQLLKEAPPHCSLTWLDLGYSTSVRHGGVHASIFGGSLRSALSFLADAEIAMYLDDDDWLAPEHCTEILAAIAGKKWAFAYSIYANADTGEPYCVDEFESVGVNRGVFAERFGGFVRPSGMAVNKLKLLHILHLFSLTVHEQGIIEDRIVFSYLKEQPHGCTGKASVYYSLDPKDGMHPQRLEFMRHRQAQFGAIKKTESVFGNDYFARRNLGD